MVEGRAMFTQLVQQLQHRTLDLSVSVLVVVESLRTDGIELINAR